MIVIGFQEDGSGEIGDLRGSNTGELLTAKFFGQAIVEALIAGEPQFGSGDVLFNQGYSATLVVLNARFLTGPLNVYAAYFNIATPVTDLEFTSSFEVDSLPPNWKVTTENYLGTLDTLLSSHTFTSTGQVTETATASTIGTLTLYTVFRIEPAGLPDLTDFQAIVKIRAAPAVVEVAAPDLALVFTGLTGLLPWLARRKSIFQVT